MKILQLLLALTMIITAQSVWATDEGANLVAVGQGISSPTSTSTVNYSNGFTVENPVGVLYQNATRLSLQYDQNDPGTTKAYGFELGYGKKEWGVALGYYKRDCSGCDGRFAADLAASAGDFGFGVRVAEDKLAVGVLFGVHDPHRIGIVVDTDNSGGSGNKLTSYGLGYSYVASDFTFSLDASKRNNENSGANNDITLLTPGLMVRASVFQITLNDRITSDNTNKTTTHDAWFGVGIGTGKNWHFVAYSDYVRDLAMVASFYF